MSGFFGIIMTSLRPIITTYVLSVSSSATKQSISVTTLSNTEEGSLSYLWKIISGNAIIDNPEISTTTLSCIGVSGTTELFCNITNSVTGVTYMSPSCTITWSAKVPSDPIIGLSSAGDTTFTINWTTPTDDGGEPIIGYKVQYSTDGGNNWSTLEDAGLVLTYKWSALTNGLKYIARVLAYNSIGDGLSSSNSVERIPTLAAPI